MVELSNTWLLEEIGMVRILAEPTKCWHENLRNNRQCSIEYRCVSHTSGETLSFEVPFSFVKREQPPIMETGHQAYNSKSLKYTVETTS